MAMERDEQRRGKDAEEEGEMAYMPEGCIANFIASTSPRDACRLSAVSTLFKSAAESDAVWDRFLPPDYERLISESESLTSSSSSSSLPSLRSKKEIFLSLCDNPILIDEGKKSFHLDKWSGKKCYMIAARELLIVWGDTPMYWSWHSLPGARFPEVAELNTVCWFEVRGKISTSLMSPSTLYSAYLVFKPTKGVYGFENIPVEVTVGLVGSESRRGTVSLHVESKRDWRLKHRRQMRGLFGRVRSVGQAFLPTVKENEGRPKERADAWLEVELGDFYNAGDGEGELEMGIFEVQIGNWKGGLLVQGIEVRPKRVNK